MAKAQPLAPFRCFSGSCCVGFGSIITKDQGSGTNIFQEGLTCEFIISVEGGNISIDIMLNLKISNKYLVDYSSLEGGQEVTPSSKPLPKTLSAH